MPRAPCSRKTNGTQHACTTYILLLIRTLIGTYLACCLVQGRLRCALLCSRSNDIRTRKNCGTAVCCCIRTARRCLLQSKTIENEDSMLQMYKMLEYIHAGFGQLCTLASVAVWYARKRTLCEARHSTAPHGTARRARHRTAPHGAALRRVVALAKLN